MRICKFRYIFVFMAILFLFAACSQNSATRKAETFYKEYANTFITDRANAVNNYIHYEDVFLYHAAIADIAVPFYRFEMRDIEKLSDSLWVVTAYIESDYQDEGYEITNYIGILNGEFKIMVNDLQIPAELKEGVDLSSYIPSDRIPYEDLFLPESYAASIGN